MTIAERPARREGWTEGRWLIGADGSAWCLPVLDEATWDGCPRLRESFEPGAMSGDAESAGLLVDVLFELLGANYEVDAADLATVLATPGGEPKLAPLLVLLAYLFDSSAPLNHLAVADRMGLDRGEVHACVEMARAVGPLRGWHGHDGPLFEN